MLRSPAGFSPPGRGAQSGEGDRDMSETTGGESTEGSGSVLVEASVETVPSAATAEDAAVAVAAPIDSGTLALQDVLQGLHSDAGALGVYLRLESVGNDTIVSVDPGAFTVSVPIATIDNVIGVTLQQLLNNDLIT